jgi:hypothetical protein
MRPSAKNKADARIVSQIIRRAAMLSTQQKMIGS